MHQCAACSVQAFVPGPAANPKVRTALRRGSRPVCAVADLKTVAVTSTPKTTTAWNNYVSYTWHRILSPPLQGPIIHNIDLSPCNNDILAVDVGSGLADWQRARGAPGAAEREDAACGSSPGTQIGEPPGTNWGLPTLNPKFSGVASISLWVYAIYIYMYIYIHIYMYICACTEVESTYKPTYLHT